ncbi:MAG: RNA 2',3'-cyclic phosphodiesterase [Pseudomonadota bacterium]
MRLFAALTPPESVRDRLEALQSGLAGRHSPPENFHVTLAFFGELDPHQAQDLGLALEKVSAEPFEYWLDGVDVFGGARPRLAYAAVRPEPALKALRDAVRRAGSAAGVDLPAERYTPHITLSRSPGKADERLKRWLAGGARFLAGPIAATEFGLFRSDLGKGAPVYSEIARYQIRA